MKELSDGQKKFVELAKTNVATVLGSRNMQGFEKAFIVSGAIAELKTAITQELMLPIMALQGNKLGFKTDKDTTGGYGMEVVKNCLIEAVLIGLQPVGNQFNIISGNMYPTREGFKHLLDDYPGLVYDISFQLPRMGTGSAAVVMEIEWSLNGSPKEKKNIDFPIRVNSGMGTDAVIGKATRKAEAWLYNKVTGMALSDGDVQDADFTVTGSKMKDEPIPFEEIEFLFLNKKDQLSDADRIAGQRIIDNKEVNSYAKLKLKLKDL